MASLSSIKFTLFCPTYTFYPVQFNQKVYGRSPRQVYAFHPFLSSYFSNLNGWRNYISYKSWMYYTIQLYYSQIKSDYEHFKHPYWKSENKCSNANKKITNLNKTMKKKKLQHGWLTVSWAAPLIPRSWLKLEPVLAGAWDSTAQTPHKNLFVKNTKLWKMSNNMKP